MKNCTSCLESSSCGNCSSLSYRQLIMAVLAAVAIFGLLWFGSSQVRAKENACFTREQVEKAAAEQNKCLTIYDNKVYDFTTAKAWDLTGHVGKHLCGKEYDKETIEAGPHKLAVIDRFYLTPVCGYEDQVSSKRGILEFLFGGTISLRRIMVYVSLVFFILNFATCYAMPWAKLKEPWKGDLPGPDSKDLVGNFPLTHWHKVWAWFAIFSLSLHAILGFSCLWFGKCF